MKRTNLLGTLTLLGLMASVLTVEISVPSPEECPRIMKSAGITPLFAPTVAHSIHSLTLEDLRYHFKDNATEDNGIPTVNPDLESDQRVLPDAPLVGYDDEFSTQAMNSFDLVMRNMNRTWWGVSEYSVLEKVAHAVHMAEVWSAAGKEYRRIGKLVDPDSHLCRCVRDVDGSGMIDHLHLIAFKLRYPGINNTNGKYYLIAADLIHPNNKNFRNALRKKRSVTVTDTPTNFEVKVNRGKLVSVEIEYDKVDKEFSAGAHYGVEVLGFEAKAGAALKVSDGAIRGVLEAKWGDKTYELIEVFEVNEETIENIKEAYENTKDAVAEAMEKVDDFVDRQVDKAKDWFSYDNDDDYYYDDDDDDDDYDYYYDYDDSSSSSSSSSSYYDDYDYDDDYDYYYGWWKRSHQSDGSDDLNFSLSDLELLKDFAAKLVEEDVELRDMESVEEWEYWRKMLKLPNEDSASFELALFMHCTLN